MTERGYQLDIKRKCEALGVWRTEFERTQKRLAKIYTRIDRVEALFIESGEKFLIAHKNNKGETNPVRNPYIAEIDLLYEQALTYEKELGLTAAALKKINEDALHAKAASPLATLEKLMGEKKVVKMA